MDLNNSNNENSSTSSSWVKKEQPTGLSSLAPYKDGYKDILQERRGEMDLTFALKTRKGVPSYKYNKPRGYNSLKNDVLSSDRVKYTIEKLSGGSKSKEEELRKEAELIYTGMAHHLTVRGVRVMAFMVIKVFKSLFRRVYVNEEGVHKLRQLFEEYPILLMPTHRSYMDFLLVTYICYHYDLPVPAVVAAMDFKGMKFMGWLLQKCGAFYIRRSFGSDHLYWSIFTEYVQSQMRNGDQPLEFFVEGTRSRTNKSYTPKMGVLSAVLESYFKGELPDTMVVPITITYDRIVEESLYAYELLGIPKPKETTSGLLKARSVLEDDFGSVHFHIGDSISVRQFSSGKIDRICHSLEPRYINHLLQDEKVLIRELAYSIVKQQQAKFIVAPGALVAAVMMQHRHGLHVNKLAEKVDWLKMQACNLGAYVDWPGTISLEEVVKRCVTFHQNILRLDGVTNMVELRLSSPTPPLASPSPPSSSSSPPSLPLSSSPATPLLSKELVLSNAVVNLTLSLYRNHLLHLFVNCSLVLLSVRSKLGQLAELPLNDIYSSFTFLEHLLSRDFVFEPDKSKQTFNQTILHLRNTGILVLKSNPGNQLESVILSSTVSQKVATFDSVPFARSADEQIHFLCQMIEPFLLVYWLACKYLSALSSDKFGRPLPRRQKDMVLEIQGFSQGLVLEGAVEHLEVLSLDTIGNAVNSLIDFGAITRNRRNEEVWLSPNLSALSSLGDTIGEYIETPLVPVADAAAVVTTTPMIRSKL